VCAHNLLVDGGAAPQNISVPSDLVLFPFVLLALHTCVHILGMLECVSETGFVPCLLPVPFNMN